MKCPKCGYLGFEEVERCRNCGYDFSLTPSAFPELTLGRDTHTPQPLDDLSLIDAASSAPPLLKDVDVHLDRLFGAPEPAELPAPARQTAEGHRSPPRARPQGEPSIGAGGGRGGSAAAASSLRDELPLFVSSLPDDQPLITRASPPRTPLAVRRATPEMPKLRADTPRAQAASDLAIEIDESMFTAAEPDERRAALWKRDGPTDASVLARLLAVAIDLLILATIDAVVIYFTMQICNVSIDDLGILPKGPLLAFLFVQNGGYLVAFTAGGQTLGKMAAGIRVVPSDPGASVDLGRAFLRTLMWGLLAVPAGLGFVSAIFSRDHRGLHDRFAGTRVVRASV